MTLGEKLKEARIQCGLSQEQLAEKWQFPDQQLQSGKHCEAMPVKSQI